jgi:hypothetical protein
MLARNVIESIAKLIFTPNYAGEIFVSTGDTATAGLSINTNSPRNILQTGNRDI